MSQAITETRRTYIAQRGVSQGASLTLFFSSGGCTARYECAKRAAEVLGDRHYSNHGWPLLFIPTEDLQKALSHLSETFSIALVDTVTDEKGTRFALVWKIAARGSEKSVGEIDLDEY